MDDTAVRINVLNGLADIKPDAWNAVANPPGMRFDPFLSWEFLETLESSGAARSQTGWTPAHLIAKGADDQVRGAMPLYVKTNSQGEFVFDHSWANAFENAGGSYFPKLLSGVPFTPVTGRRRLVPDGPDAGRIKLALLSGALQLAQKNGFSSVHLNFLEPTEAKILADTGLLHRTDQQFHWVNEGYQDFEDFLGALSSAKRKNLRKERRKAAEGLTFEHITGDAITDAHWDVFYQFYLDTGSRKWGSPYLNRSTFSMLGERMADRLLLVFALEAGNPIAGALNLIGSDTLYGRYWGCMAPRPMLHFEVCYYQAID
ncbi:MAG: GNAT family N-acetyltransferase, partial [Pseudomonadota bacterium]